MPENSMKMRLKYVVEDTDCHGNVRLYCRRSGRKTRLHAVTRRGVEKGADDGWFQIQYLEDHFSIAA